MSTNFSDPGRKDEDKDQALSEDILEIIQPGHRMNTYEGSEFMDDGLRMKDQPFGDTETGEAS